MSNRKTCKKELRFTAMMNPNDEEEDDEIGHGAFSRFIGLTRASARASGGHNVLYPSFPEEVSPAAFHGAVRGEEGDRHGDGREDASMADDNSSDDDGSGKPPAKKQAVEAPATGNDGVKPRSRWPGRGVSDSLKELFSHFTKLDERYVSSNSKKMHSLYMCVCNYCKMEYEADLDDAGSIHQLSFLTGAERQPPAKIRREKRSCKSHLKRCPAYARYLKSAPRTTVPVSESHQDGEQGAANSQEGGQAFKTELDGSQQVGYPSEGVSVAAGLSSAPNSAAAGGGALSKSPAGRPARGTRTNDTSNSTGVRIEDIKAVHEKLVEWIVDSEIPLNMLETPAFLRFLESVRPGFSMFLPKKNKVKAEVTKAANEARADVASLVKKAISCGHFIGLSVDRHADSVVLRAGSQTLPVDTVTCGNEHDAIPLARAWEELLSKYRDYHIKSFCSDDVGQSAKARRILSLRWPFMMFTCCWAHQINLMVKALLKSVSFCATAKKSIAAATAINQSSSKWMTRLRDIADDIYGEVVSKKIYTVRATRWNTMQSCFASQLRIKEAIGVFVERHSDDPTFPGALLPWSQLSFFTDLEQATVLIQPLADASFILQRPSNTLAHVMFIMLATYQHISKFGGNSPEAIMLLNDLERRWCTQEQHLFFLAFVLHPYFQPMSKQIIEGSKQHYKTWTDAANPLVEARILQAARFYYGKFDLYEPDDDETAKEEARMKLTSRLQMWMREPKSLEGMNTNMFRGIDDAWEFWDSAKDEHAELARLAMFLFDIPVQSADCERMFKDFSRNRTNDRNRQARDFTVVDCTQIKHFIKRRYPEEPVKSGSNKQTTSSNRSVNPKEYPQRLVVENDEGAEMDERDDQDMETNDAGGASDGDDELTARKNGEDEVDYWRRALQAVVPASDADFFDADTSINGEDDNSDDESKQDDMDPDELEMSFEKRMASLPPLPEFNDGSVPQENSAYFKNKKYVRCDKFPLARMLLWDKEDATKIELPPMKSVFGKKPK